MVAQKHCGETLYLGGTCRSLCFTIKSAFLACPLLEELIIKQYVRVCLLHNLLYNRSIYEHAIVNSPFLLFAVVCKKEFSIGILYLVTIS